MPPRSPAAAAVPASSSPHTSTHFPLLEVPNAPLAAVLQALADADYSSWQHPDERPPPRSVLSAGRACMRLHAAGAPVIYSVSTNNAGQPHLDSLRAYLARHGRHVTSIAVSAQPRTGAPLPIKPLPRTCSGLRELSLERLQLMLGTVRAVKDGEAREYTGFLPGLSGLTRLRLVDCTCSTAEQPAVAAAAVAALTQLQHLELRRVSMQPGVLPGSMLAPLTGLTLLQLEGEWLEDSSLEHLTALSGLRHLQLQGQIPDFQQRLTAAALAGVQQLQRLTALELQSLSFTVSLPGLPSALQHLAVDACHSLDPQTLAGLSQLQELNLFFSPLTGGAGGVAALLQHVGQMTQLTRLNLGHSLRDIAPDAVSYAALTASSSLVKLSMESCRLPAAGWQAMFGGTKSLPRLQEVDMYPPDAVADMAAVVRCCPAARKLPPYKLRLDADVDLGALSQLWELGIAAGCSDEWLAQLAQLTGLQRLSIYHSPAITPTGLAHLTALTRLTHLSVSFNSCVSVLTDQHGNLLLSSEDPARPDVAAQLGALLERARLEEQLGGWSMSARETASCW